MATVLYKNVKHYRAYRQMGYKDKPDKGGPRVTIAHRDAAITMSFEDQRIQVIY